MRFQNHAEAPTLVAPDPVPAVSAPRHSNSVRCHSSGPAIRRGQGWESTKPAAACSTFSTMLENRSPDFFIHSGDSIYADCAISSRSRSYRTAKSGKTSSPKKSPSRPETLAEFRGNYKYHNLLDRNVRAFNTEVPMLCQWDDHEVTNDWGPGEAITWNRYTEKSMLALSARGSRAFHEYMPTRQSIAEQGVASIGKMSYGPLLDVFLIDACGLTGPQTSSVTRVKFSAKNSLRGSSANSSIRKRPGKSSPPILPHWHSQRRDAVAMGDGAPQGRECEIADLLAFMKHAGIVNTVWLTADMHYTAAHYYDPNAAVFQDFDPFWEFVSGPLHSGSWSASPLDNTFGPKADVCESLRQGAGANGDNLAPCFGMQFFGHVAIDGNTEVMTVTLKDVDDRALWSVPIEPRKSRRSGP